MTEEEEVETGERNRKKENDEEQTKREYGLFRPQLHILHCRKAQQKRLKGKKQEEETEKREKRFT